MRNILLSVVVVAVLIAAGVGGTMAGFVDTEESIGNRIQAGILDLKINDLNDPIGPKVTTTHMIPCKSMDFFVKAENWGDCMGGELWMRFKDVVSSEDGRKDDMVYVRATNSYRPAAGNEPIGAGVASSEPEAIAEEGNGVFGQVTIGPNDPTLSWQDNLALRQGLGVDYASGIAEHLGVTVEVCDDDGDGYLDNPDDDLDGVITLSEYQAHTWVGIASLTGKLDTLNTKDLLGYLDSQDITYIHIIFHLQQIEDVGCPNPQVKYWPSNALQGDKVVFSMEWELLGLDP